MKIFFFGRYQYTPMMIMRKCGYIEIQNRQNGQTSYVRKFGAGHYPRFHAYVDLTDDGIHVNLHLDQKQPTYGKQTSHSGEYDGDVVEREGARIFAIINSLRV